MDFYAILGLERTASIADIKRAYRRLARKYHPDINPGDAVAAAQFRRISQAYETLSDPDRRRRYDVGGLEPSAADPSTFGFEGFDFTATVSGAAASTFGDLFGDVIGRRQDRRAQPERGADLHHALTLGFEEAMRGGPRTITVTRQEHCRGCGGAGVVRTSETHCFHCNGTGSVKSARGHMVFSRACPHCEGTGRHGELRCPTCGGRQIEIRTEPLTVDVPPGLADGARVRLPGKGHAGPNGGEHGDLYVTVRVEPHPLFRREGDDLHVTVPVAIHEAALGARIEVPTLDGPTRVRVPPGTQSGQRFRLHERGVPSPHDGRRGDLIVEVRIVLPKLLDERSKEILREFGKINGEDVRRDLLKSANHGGH